MSINKEVQRQFYMDSPVFDKEFLLTGNIVILGVENI